MNLGYMLHGGAPVKKRYRVSATMTTAVGIPVMLGTTANAGLVFLPSTAITAVTDCVGVTLDTAVYTTTPTAATPEGIITVIINPDAIYRMHMSAGNTAGTQLNLTTNDVAESAGSVIDKTGAAGSGDNDIISPDMIEGTIICVSGANKGQMRTCTTTGSTSATAGVAFLAGIGVGDEFIIVPWNISSALSNNAKLTTNLAEVAQSTAAGTGVSFALTDMEFDFADTTSARRNSFLYGKFLDHVFDYLTT